MSGPTSAQQQQPVPPSSNPSLHKRSVS
jgi:hypothetical protein